MCLACQGNAEDGDGVAARAAEPPETPVRAPRLAHADTGPVVELPPGMRRALAAHAPGFVPWRRDAYDADVLAHFANDSTTALFGVVGDFNGDGAPDVALQGQTQEHEVFFVVLAADDTAHVIEFRRRERFFEPRGLARDVYVRPVRAGSELEVSTEVAEPPPDLRFDAFMEVFEGRASLLYYWTGENFATYVIGD